MGCGCDNICSKCLAGKYIVIGIIVFAVAQFWIAYIWHVLGVLLIVKGIIKIAKPEGCGHCGVPATAKKGKK